MFALPDSKTGAKDVPITPPVATILAALLLGFGETPLRFPGASPRQADEQSVQVMGSGPQKLHVLLRPGFMISGTRPLALAWLPVRP